MSNHTPTHPQPARLTRAGWVVLILAAVLFGFATAPHVGTTAYRSTMNHTHTIPTTP